MASRHIVTICTAVLVVVLRYGNARQASAESPIDCNAKVVLVDGGSKCLNAGESFIDGKGYPEMTVMPGGRIAAGKYEITFGQFGSYAKETGMKIWDDCISPFGKWDKSYIKPGFEQRPTSPAVCISWSEAQGYASWLSSRTGQTYRLPTQEEHASILEDGKAAVLAEANVCRYANTADLTLGRRFVLKSKAQCNDKYVFTAPVGMKQPDELGLFDVIGNAEEMVDTCPGKDSLTCAERAVDGGSWMSLPGELGQRRFLASWRSNTVGFRLVRDLKP